MARYFRLCLALIIVANMAVGCTDETIGRYRSESVSMQPNLWEGEYFFTDNLAYVDKVPQRGDVVVFNRLSGPQFIKRAIGLPGETIEIRDAKVFINGLELAESYVKQPMDYSMPALTIEPDHYFVLGDNRSNSSDSHVWGAIDVSDIIGRATFVYYPFKQMRLIPQPKYAVK